MTLISLYEIRIWIVLSMYEIRIMLVCFMNKNYRKSPLLCMMYEIITCSNVIKSKTVESLYDLGMTSKLVQMLV